jgi:hypothetical protein
MPPQRMAKSGEFYSCGDQGPRDAELHEQILATGNDVAVRAIGRAVAKRAGLTDPEIIRLYGDEDK